MMDIKINRLFENSLYTIPDWINWFSLNLYPFPIQVEFLLDTDNLIAVLNTELSPFNPVYIYNVTYNSKLIASIVITVERENDSAEVTHLILDKSIHKTYLSGLSLLKIGEFIDNFMIQNKIIYAQTSIPISATALDTALLKFKWNKKAILNLYQKVRTNEETFRRDVIYFEKIYNKNLL